MKTLNQWFEEYGDSHQNHTNQIIHKICVPLIFFSTLGMLWDFKLLGISGTVWFIAATFWFYIALGMKSVATIVPQILISLWCFVMWEKYTDNIFVPCLIIFAISWIGQFIGHKIEGKNPSFMTNLQFLLVGPLWVFLGKK